MSTNHGKLNIRGVFRGGAMEAQPPSGGFKAPTGSQTQCKGIESLPQTLIF